METLEKTSLQAAAEDCYATDGDVACDSCTDRRLKALKSCLVCRVSYCERHLQPHYESQAFEKHRLVEPLKNLQEKFCSRHEEVMKIFCRTDQQTICFLCLTDEHKDHDIVSAVAERKEKQTQLGMSRTKIQQRIQSKERDVQVLQKEIEAINQSATKALKDSERILTELIRLIEKRSTALQEQMKSQQDAEINRVRELEGKLKQEITELREKDAELEQLTHTHDNIQFIHSYSSLSDLSDYTDSLAINVLPLVYFDNLTRAVAETRDKLQHILTEEWQKISHKVVEVDVLLPHSEPKAREDFLQYSCRITLDPNTVNTWLSLSEGNRKVTVMKEKQPYSNHPDRFSDGLQALSTESLTGRCYWEVERGSGGVLVAAAYRDINRSGQESVFGNNNKSWVLGCFDITYYFKHNNRKCLLSGPISSKIGVFLDHKAGTLSFYSIADSMTLLYKVQTAFTQPLYAGIWVYWVGDTAKFCEMK